MSKKKRSTFRGNGSISNLHILARRGMAATQKRIQWLSDTRRERSDSELDAMSRAAAKRAYRGRYQDFGAWA